jgi:hypothetical protein
MMTVTKMSGLRPLGRFGLAVVLLIVLVRSPLAHADSMLLASTNMVSGTSSATFSFDAPTNGVVTAQLTTIAWPTPLSALSFSATSATNTLASWASTSPSATAPYVDTFQVGSGTYFAHVSATAGGSLDLGLYSLMLTFTPSAVPLPAAIGMLLMGLLIFFGLRTVLETKASRNSFSMTNV